MGSIEVSYWGNANKSGRKEVVKPNLLVVEGDDEIEFFRVLLKRLQIDEIQICSVDGKDNFKKSLRTIVASPHFEDIVQKIAIIRDADQNANGAFQSLQNIIQNDLKLKAPVSINRFTGNTPQIGVYIMPGHGSSGMIEDICLESVAEKPQLACVDKFMLCADDCGLPLKNPAKRKVAAYLAIMEEPGVPLGIAAAKGYWNLEAPVLDELKAFLENLR